MYQGYLSLLAEASADGSAVNGDALMEEHDNAYSAQDSRKAWYKRTLAALGAFLRKHYMSVAAVAVQIEQGVTEGVSADVKEVVMKSVQL